MNFLSAKSLRTLALGGLSGALVFFGLRAMADPPSLTVRELHSNIKPFIGTDVTITGLAYYIKSETRTKNGQSVPYTKLNLYETDAKGKKGKNYVYVAIPTNSFKFTPNEGDNIGITGKLDWATMIAQIEE